MSDLPIMTGTRTALLLLMASAASLCFNLDTEQPTTFQVDSAGFGHSVVQYANTGLVVGAPREIQAANQTGGLYQCDYRTSRCQPIHLQVPPEAVNMSLGLSLAASTNPSQLLACGPTVHHACRENVHLTGLCFLLTSSFRWTQRFPAALQECPKQEQDIAFLIDGSGSISPSDFATMISFVRAVMSQFQRPSTQFSLMQFSHKFWIHFTFNEFVRSPYPLSLLNSVRQLRGFTHTATAIRMVINELFSARSGARKDATKILIVITDGQKEGDHLDYKDVIPMAEAAGVIRYAIGVGLAFQKSHSWKELNDIASKPSQEYIFRVNNFDALKDIQNQLKEKIFAIEGTETKSGSSFEWEMAQEGFSAVFTPDGPVLGAVGSFSWSGGAFLYQPNKNPTFLNMSEERVDMRDSYLGYSTELALWKGEQNLVLGAPRYQHTGKVVIFTPGPKQWRLKAEVTGTQTGSYFGASLCSMDVNRDGNTDLVLIGAPHFYEQTQGGRVSVCPLPKVQGRWQCVGVLRGEPGHPWGRFGAALTVLGDVNGDKLADMVMGARIPIEKEKAPLPKAFQSPPRDSLFPLCQRVAGSQLSPRLQYFGQSLSGGQDLTEDGLVDLAVGAQGHALLLRTRPVLQVWMSIRFTPPEIPRSVYECQEQVAPVRTLGDATVCLHIYKSSKNRLSDLQSSVTFDLALDPGRPSSRAVFKETNTRTLSRARDLGLTQYCEAVPLLLPACVEDSMTPIIMRLNFSLEGKQIPSFGKLRPMLDVNSQRYLTASLPFEKNCGDDRVCQDDLSISFDFSGLNTLLVGSNLELNVAVALRNDGEDSYRTTVTFSYPAGLSYRRVTEGQNQLQLHSPRLTCDSVPAGSQDTWTTSCSSNHLIFRGGAQITFLATFDVSPRAVLGDRLLLTANVSSDNNTPRTSKTTFQLELPVKYTVYTVISSHEQSTKYLNFSASEKQQSSVAQHRYQVNNLGQRDLPVSIYFWVPMELHQEPVWMQVEVSCPQNPSMQCSSERIAPPESDFLNHIQKNAVLDCSIAACLRLRCDIPSFGVQEELDFVLKGNLSFGWVSQTLQKKVSLVSVAEITFDRSVYAQLPGQEAFLRAQTETVLEEYKVHNPIPLIAGSSVGGLLLLALITATLYKVGFFKRQYKEMMQEENQQIVPGNEAQIPEPPSEEQPPGSSDLLFPARLPDSHSHRSQAQERRNTPRGGAGIRPLSLGERSASDSGSCCLGRALCLVKVPTGHPQAGVPALPPED
ncbi:LOW QUALITY PROTEIN: integrin alpha-X [Tupaia chinensis]|uniref:LOW QUALITY PROTEIN: integrin alpha-X n=1 Tax=Tupaia chinensis TaxID=246437 RepID=UPI0003C8D79A|nr:LOW QUALITY PROTEIN: integrin alpha-X [Tupaia chinensis]